MKNGYLAFVLDDLSRQRILDMFPPRFPDVITHHVTLMVGDEQPTNKTLAVLNSLIGSKSVQVIGYALGDYCEAVLVSINGRTATPQGRSYHVTVSIDRSNGAKPVWSNEVIKNAIIKPIVPVYIKGTIEFCQF
jgi:hypothetical protein